MKRYLMLAFASFSVSAAEVDEAAKAVVGRTNAFREYCIVLENIAYLYRSRGYDTATLAQELLEGWKKSPEHRKKHGDPLQRREPLREENLIARPSGGESYVVR